jgi:hypothetical protein
MPKPQPAQKTRVRVPQDDGEISISRRGDIDTPVIYPVTNGTVEVDEADIGHFLTVIDGAELADTPTPPASTPADQPTT